MLYGLLNHLLKNTKLLFSNEDRAQFAVGAHLFYENAIFKKFNVQFFGCFDSKFNHLASPVVCGRPVYPEVKL